MFRQLWKRIGQWFEDIIGRANRRYVWRHGTPVSWRREVQSVGRSQETEEIDADALLRMIIEAANAVGADPRHATADLTRWGGMPTWVSRRQTRPLKEEKPEHTLQESAVLQALTSAGIDVSVKARTMSQYDHAV